MKILILIKSNVMMGISLVNQMAAKMIA